MSLWLLAVAVWMTLQPRWWIELLDRLQKALDHWAPDRLTLATRNVRLPDDRRTRTGVRVFGVLLSLVAVAYLYREIARFLAR
ncbi:MAG TPA: hypothetical protein VME43_25205 [Bryobacteraceae bacterium]|nr:hypothetical protein [Bryobacteraceae bacterium]